MVELLWWAVQGCVPGPLAGSTFFPDLQGFAAPAELCYCSPAADTMPSLKAFSFVLLWLVAGQGCLRAAGELEPTLAFRLLADDPSTFDLLNEPEWHPRLSKALLGDDSARTNFAFLEIAHPNGKTQIHIRALAQSLVFGRCFRNRSRRSWQIASIDPSNV